MTSGQLPTDEDGKPYVVGRIWGHHLVEDGEAYLAVDCYTGRCSTNVGGTTRQANAALESVGGPGHALCACGVLSGHLDTGRARRRWHRQHKARIVLEQPEPDGQPTPINPLDVA